MNPDSSRSSFEKCLGKSHPVHITSVQTSGTNLKMLMNTFSLYIYMEDLFTDFSETPNNELSEVSQLSNISISIGTFNLTMETDKFGK